MVAMVVVVRVVGLESCWWCTMFGAGDTERRLRMRFANATSLRHQGTLSIVLATQ